jgi:hypothetical protein
MAVTVFAAWNTKELVSSNLWLGHIGEFELMQSIRFIKNLPQISRGSHGQARYRRDAHSAA